MSCGLFSFSCLGGLPPPRRTACALAQDWLRLPAREAFGACRAAFLGRSRGIFPSRLRLNRIEGHRTPRHTALFVGPKSCRDLTQTGDRSRDGLGERLARHAAAC